MISATASHLLNVWVGEGLLTGSDEVLFQGEDELRGDKVYGHLPDGRRIVKGS